MKHLFIINPNAGKKKKTAQLEHEIKELDCDCEVVYTGKQGDAERFAREAAQSGEPVRIYACGGDGTLNEVVNGAAGYDNAAITNVPIGTGNDYLKIFGPKNRERFCDLKALKDGPQAAMDLIDCNGKLGIGVVCAGVDARIAYDVDRYKRLPLIRGIGAYILSLIVNVMFKGISRPTVVDIQDLHYVGETSIICICCGRYYGGGFMPVGDNMPDDGKFEVLIVPKVGRFTFFRLVSVYAKGGYRQLADRIWAYQGTELSFRSNDERDLIAVIDGEGMVRKDFKVKIADQKVNFFYPADLNYNPL